MHILYGYRYRVQGDVFELRSYHHLLTVVVVFLALVGMAPLAAVVTELALHGESDLWPFDWERRLLVAVTLPSFALLGAWALLLWQVRVDWIFDRANGHAVRFVSTLWGGLRREQERFALRTGGRLQVWHPAGPSAASAFRTLSLVDPDGSAHRIGADHVNVAPHAPWLPALADFLHACLSDEVAVGAPGKKPPVAGQGQRYRARAQALDGRRTAPVGAEAPLGPAARVALLPAAGILGTLATLGGLSVWQGLTTGTLAALFYPGGRARVVFTLSEEPVTFLGMLLLAGLLTAGLFKALWMGLRGLVTGKL